MQQVVAMKEQVRLALGPKDVRIEDAVDREKRKAQLARYLIRASRAVDIEMGFKSNSILQNDCILHFSSPRSVKDKPVTRTALERKEVRIEDAVDREKRKAQSVTCAVLDSCVSCCECRNGSQIQ
jgi:hypothetical protein